MSSNTLDARTMSARLKLGASVMALTTVLGTGAAFAQPTDEPMETVVVTGYRASLEGALKTKRVSNEMIDAINADDVAAFPDANLAEALQRLPGVQVDRENGEGRSITVRGLDKNFTRVTMNGLQALSTAGTSDGAGNPPNRDRGFDFNTFASELFGSLTVQKSASAATEEGSLGATVALRTPRPFDMDVDQRFVVSAQNAWYELGKPFNPRITGLASKTFFGGRLGVLASVAYSSKTQILSSYARSPGQSDYVYRGSDFKWTGGSASAGFNNVAGGLLGRNGFAAPTTAVCNGTIAPYSPGVVPGNNVTNAAYCNALRGSDPAAYALVNTPQGWTITDTNPGSGTSSQVTAPGSLTRFPALPTLNQQNLYQSKLGITSSVQWQVDDKTLISVDGLFSSTYQDSTNYGITPVGLNRNNTSTTLNTASTSTAASTLRAMFYSCAAQTGSATQADIDCGQSLNGTTLVPGTAFSNNPHNLDIYDYYTSATYGYNPNKSDAIAKAIQFVGRPASKVIEAHVTGDNADYLKLDNVDMRSGADQVYYTTQFEQLSMAANRDFTDRLRADITVGWSKSYNHQSGFLAEVNRMDSGTANGDNYFVYDSTGGGEMPELGFGFNVADPAKWDFVKGFSALRHYEYYTTNTYRTLIAGAAYELTDQFTLRAGMNARIFDFDTSYYQRAMRDVLNPSLQEVGVTTAAVTQMVNWGSGLDVPQGTTTSWIAPDLQKYKDAIGFDCNCINTYGDWRVTNLFNPTSTGSAGQTYKVSEHSKSYYLQLDLQNLMILGNPLRGNIGTRVVTTSINSTGHALQGQIIRDKNDYTDVLPSANLAYSLTDDMLLRAAGALVMARPSLSLMAPSITAMSIPSNGTSTTGATMAFGNTHLKPFRAKTFDLGWEWYFDEGAVLAVTGFIKWVKDNPQVVVSSGPISSFLTADQIQQVRQFYVDNPSTANTNILGYIDADNSIAVTQALNSQGGVLEGVEFTYQQHLDFIPPVFGGQGFGVNANYTHIKTKQHYIINATTTQTLYGDGPWNGASPDAFNFTLYYDSDNWSGRVSTAYRSSYLYLYPVASGSDVAGFGNAPLVDDFGYSKGTLNVDAAFSYDFNENMQLTLDALNLTNQPDRRWAYTAARQPTKYAATGRQVYVGFRLKY